MSSSKYFTLAEVDLNNNCPECYSNNGLQLTFKQKFIETVFYKKITTDTINEMHCNNCDTQIFPVRWTEDIERVVAYQERAKQPKSKSLKLKSLAWFFVLCTLILSVAVVLYITGFFPSKL